MPGFSTGHWPKTAIGGLVLVNVILLVLLTIEQRSPTFPAEAVAPSPPTISEPSPTSARLSTTPSPISVNSEPTTPSTASSTTSPTTGLAPARRLLAVNSATLGWRALGGQCPTDPKVEVSSDGGRTWQPTDSGLGSISRMRSDNGDNGTAVFAVGGDEKCESRYAATGGPGESWRANRRLLGQTWYRLPSERHRIHAPGGRLSSPCDDRLADFAGLGIAGAAALCSDGTLLLTQDGGRHWRPVDGVATARAVGAEEKVYVLALRTADCAGIGVVLLTPEARKVDSHSVRCAPLGRDDEDIAVAVRGQVVWLWVGDEVAVSTDRGRNWERP